MKKIWGTFLKASIYSSNINRIEVDIPKGILALQKKYPELVEEIAHIVEYNFFTQMQDSKITELILLLKNQAPSCILVKKLLMLSDYKKKFGDKVTELQNLCSDLQSELFGFPYNMEIQKGKKLLYEIQTLLDELGEERETTFNCLECQLYQLEEWLEDAE